MKISKSLSSIFFLGLAVTVTVGSMYVTVSAAARQAENTETVPEPVAVAADEPIGAPLIESQIVPPVPVATVSDEAPADVRHDRQHHVSLDANGGFSGMLSSLGQTGGNLQPSAAMQVRLIRDGVVIAATTTAADGSFAFSGLSDGVVALLAYSDTGLLLYGVRLVNEGNAFAAATPVKFTPETIVDLGVSSAVVSGADLQIARELILGGMPSGAAASQAQAHGQGQNGGDKHGNGESGTAVSHHAVQLQADGSLAGHINLLDPNTGAHREVTDLTLHFIRRGELVASTEVQRNGDFEVVGLVPGIHSIVTTGEDGVVAMGLDIVGTEFQQAQANGKYKLTTVAMAVELSVSPASPVNFNSDNANDVSGGFIGGNGQGGAPGLGAPIGGLGSGPLGPVGGAPGGFGGAPGGLGGGGLGGGLGGGAAGGLGGGGGLGALLGAAAAGAIGYAVGEDRSSGNR